MATEEEQQAELRITKLELIYVHTAEKLEALIESVGQVRHILIEGNGRDPLVTRVATIETRLAEMDKRAEARAIPWSVWLGVLVSIALGILGLVVK